MSLHSWLQKIRSALAPGQRHRGRRASHRAATHRPHLELLEDRCVPALLSPIDYTAGDSPLDVKAGDFNNDGRFDLATANHDHTVSVLLGNSDGTFQSSQTSTARGNSTSVAVGDFNQDGNLDLATGVDVLGSGVPSILLGRGDGTFAPDVSPIGSVTDSIVCGDLNADGKLDLVATSASTLDDYLSTFDVTVLLGHGDGSFGPAITYNTPAEWYLTGLALADFDEDGNTDVAAIGGSAFVMLGNGDGTLRIFDLRDLGTGGRSLTVADFDADGNLDVATTNAGASVVLGNGDGTFRPAQSFAAGASPDSVNTADVNDDGVLDLVVTNADADGGRGLSVLLGDGDGSFALPITTALASSPTSLALADFNADGRPDAAVTNFGTDAVSVLFNDGVWDAPPPPPPTITINNRTCTEGNTGTANATFTLTLSRASNVDVTVHYETADILAVAGSDYTAASGDVIIPAGQTSATVMVAVRGDRLPEPTESFAVNLTAATGATIGDGQGIGAIFDDEPRISISDVSKSEGKRNRTTLLTFTVKLSAAYDEPVTMSYRTVDGTATTSDNDYVAKSGTLTFAPGETTKTITIEVKGDSKREASETFYLDLFGLSSNAQFTKNRGIATVLNDD